MFNFAGSETELRITGLYDNNTSSSNLIAGWGFSALVEFSNITVLFDVGADVSILSRNMEELNVRPEQINFVVLSHPHCDHVGGLSAVLKANTDLTVVLTDSFPQNIRKKIGNYGADLFEISGPEKISNGIISTGELTGDYRGMSLPEQGLIVRTSRGPIVIVGCSHPGIDSIVTRAIEITGEHPHLVLGGFHLGSRRNAEIKELIQKLKKSSVKRVAPSHCTGRKAKRLFKTEFGDDYLEFEVGTVISI